MNQARPIVQSAEFVESCTGFRFRLVSEPADREVRGTVVFVHGFAEEMNKSRRMTARMARLLAGDGWRVVQRDLRGCGDSSGDFGDATWTDWTNDVGDELAQVIDGRPAWLWCLRAGALLASAALARYPDVNLLLWQPVLSGAQHLQQFLRLHAGARIVGFAKVDGGLSPIQSLRSGMPVEVGGYSLNPVLAKGLEEAAFDLLPGFGGRVVWFDLSANDPSALSPQSGRMAEHLQGRGIVVEPEVVRGPPFWQTQEIEECDALLERTLELLRVDTTADPRRAARDDRASGIQRIAVHGVSR